MNKLVSIATLSMLFLSGCKTLEAVSTVSTFGSHPTVEAASEKGATKQSVLAAGTKPRKEESTVNFKGTCLDFPLSKNDESTDFYAAFNEKNQIVAWGFNTCKEQNSSLHNSEPPKKAASNSEALKQNLKSIIGS